MLQVLANRTYRHLFLAQVIALVGTGLATVALGLLAYDLAGADAGAVLGTALAIKMVAYVGVAPVAAAFAEKLPRRTMLVCLDLVRAGVAILLPLVTEVWQVYVLIFVLQSASAGFTPTFQATIPDVLPKEAVRLCELFFSGDVRGAAALQCRLLPVIDALFSEVNPIPVKAALAKMGYGTDTLRLPLTPMEEGRRAVLLNALEAWGV